MEQKLWKLLIDLNNKLTSHFAKFYNNSNFLEHELQELELNQQAHVTDTKRIDVSNLFESYRNQSIKLHKKSSNIDSKLQNSKSNTSKHIYTDEYITYWLSDMDSNFESLLELSKGSNYYNDIIIVQSIFNSWKNKMVTRTKPIFLSKAGCLSGGGIILGAYLLSNPVGMGVGLLGLTGCGCYMLWNKFSRIQLNEKECFNELIASINSLSTRLLTSINKNIIETNTVTNLTNITESSYYTDYSLYYQQS